MKECWHPLFKYVIEVKNKYIEITNNKDCYNFGEMLEALRDYVKDKEDAGISSLIEVFDPLIINCYNEYALFKYNGYIALEEKGFTEESFWAMYDGLYLECRSVVFNIKEEEIVLGPQFKFFNVNQNEKWSENNIRNKLNTADKIEISNKLDGSNQNYRYYRGEYFGSGSQAVDPKSSWRLSDGYKMLKDNYKQMLRDYPDYTFMFEFISVKNIIVVNYTLEQEGLYLFGMRNAIDGSEKTYEEVLEIGKKYGVKTTETYDDSFDDIMSKLDDYKSNEKEGWVIAIWKDNKVFKAKLKVTDYVLMHKAISKITSPNSIIEAIEADRFDDYISMVPMGFRDEVCRIANKVFEYIMKMETRARYSYIDLKHYIENGHFENPNKEAAFWIKDNVPKYLSKYVSSLFFYESNDLNFLKNKNGRYTKLKEIEELLEKNLR